MKIRFFLTIFLTVLLVAPSLSAERQLGESFPSNSGIQRLSPCPTNGDFAFANVMFGMDPSEMSGTIYKASIPGGYSGLYAFNGGSINHLAWSPDGQKIAFTDAGNMGSSSLYYISAGGGAPTLVLTSSDTNYNILTWTPDSQSIVYSAESIMMMDVSIYSIPISYDSPTLLVLDANYPALSPNGSLLAYTHNNDGFWPKNILLKPYPSGTATSITGLGSGWEAYYKLWSRDSSSLFYMAMKSAMGPGEQNISGIWKYSAGATTAIIPTTEKPTMFYISPAIDYICYEKSMFDQNPANMGIVVAKIDNTNQTFYQGGIFPIWTSDGKYVAWAKNPDIGVWYDDAPADGSDEIGSILTINSILEGENSIRVSWTSDPETLPSGQQYQIIVRNNETGQPISLYPNPINLTENTYSFENLEFNITYLFTVKIIDPASSTEGSPLSEIRFLEEPAPTYGTVTITSANALSIESIEVLLSDYSLGANQVVILYISSSESMGTTIEGVTSPQACNGNSKTISGLSPATKYYFAAQIHSTINSDAGQLSPWISCFTLAELTQISAVSTSVVNGINIIVECLPSVLQTGESYVIEGRSKSTLTPLSGSPVNQETNTYTFTDLSPGETYEFRAKISNNSDEGTFSEWNEVTIPEADRYLSITGSLPSSSNSILTTWINSTPKAGDQYFVEIKYADENVVETYPNEVCAGTNLSFNFQNLVPNNLYQVRVRIQNDTKTHPFTVWYICSLPPIPVFLGTVSANISSSTSIEVDWTSERRSDEIFILSVFKNNGLVDTLQDVLPPYEVVNLIPENSYKFEVSKKNISTAAITAPISSNEVVLPPLPSTPSDVSFNSIGHTEIQIVVNDNFPQDMMKHRLVISPLPNNYPTSLLEFSGSTHTLTGLSPGESYSITIYRFNIQTGAESPSGFTSSPISLPRIPPDIHLEAMDLQILSPAMIAVDWSRISNLTLSNNEKYAISIISITGILNQEYLISENIHSYEFRNLTGNNTYEVTVKVLNTVTEQTGNYTPATIFLPLPPSSPMNFSAIWSSDTEIEVSWTKSSDPVTEYKIYWDEGNPEALLTNFLLRTISVSNPSQANYSEIVNGSSLNKLKVYRFLIKANNSYGMEDTGYSVTHTPSTPPNAPTLLNQNSPSVVKNADGIFQYVALNWQVDTYAFEYFLYPPDGRDLNPNETMSILISKPFGTYQFATIYPGGINKIGIKAKNVYGDFSPMSIWEFDVPAIPNLNNVTNVNSETLKSEAGDFIGIKISWSYSGTDTISRYLVYYKDIQYVDYDKSTSSQFVDLYTSTQDISVGQLFSLFIKPLNEYGIGSNTPLIHSVQVPNYPDLPFNFRIDIQKDATTGITSSVKLKWDWTKGPDDTLIIKSNDGSGPDPNVEFQVPVVQNEYEIDYSSSNSTFEFNRLYIYSASVYSIDGLYSLADAQPIELTLIKLSPINISASSIYISDIYSGISITSDTTITSDTEFEKFVLYSNLSREGNIASNDLLDLPYRFTYSFPINATLIDYGKTHYFDAKVLSKSGILSDFTPISFNVPAKPEAPTISKISSYSDNPDVLRFSRIDLEFQPNGPQPESYFLYYEKKPAPITSSSTKVTISGSATTNSIFHLNNNPGDYSFALYSKNTEKVVSASSSQISFSVLEEPPAVTNISFEPVLDPDGRYLGFTATWEPEKTAEIRQYNMYRGIYPNPTTFSSETEISYTNERTYLVSDDQLSYDTFVGFVIRPVSTANVEQEAKTVRAYHVPSKPKFDPLSYTEIVKTLDSYGRLSKLGIAVRNHNLTSSHTINLYWNAGDGSCDKFLVKGSKSIITYVPLNFNDGTTYTFAMKLMNSLGVESDILPVNESIVCAYPSSTVFLEKNLTLVNDLFAGYQLCWTHNSQLEIDRYNVYEFDSQTNEYSIFLGTTSPDIKTFSISTNIVIGQERRFKVGAIAAGFETLSTDECAITINEPNEIVPEMFTVLLEKNFFAGIQFHWSDPNTDPIIKYNIYHNGGIGTEANIFFRSFDSGTTHFDVKDFIEPGRTYRFDITAMNEDHVEKKTHLPSVYVPAPLQVVPNFTPIVVSNKYEGIKLSWSDSNSNTDEYRIYCSTVTPVNPDSSFVASVAAGTKEFTFSKDTIKPDTYYFIQIGVINSVYRVETRLQTDFPVYVESPAGVTFQQFEYIVSSNSCDGMRIKWSNETNVTVVKRNLYWNEGIEGQSRTLVATIETSVVQFEHLSIVLAQKNYQYEMESISSSGLINKTKIYYTATAPGPIPVVANPIEVIKTTNSDGIPVFNEIKLSWNSHTSHAGYKIYSNISSDNVDYSTPYATLTDTTLSVNSIQFGKNYEFNVKAFDQYRIEETNGATIAFLYDKPIAPTNLSATPEDSTHIRLTWNSSVSADAKYYDVYYTILFGQQPNIYNKSVPATDLSTLIYANKDEIYSFIVKTRSDSGIQSNASDIVSLKLAPAPIDSLSISAVASSVVKLEWTHPNPTTISTYIVQSRIGTTGWFTTVAGSSGNSTLVNNVNGNYEYCFRVICATDKSIYSAPYDKTFKIIPEPPTNISATVNSRQSILLNWNQSIASYMDHYYIYSNNGLGSIDFTTPVATTTTDVNYCLIDNLSETNIYQFSVQTGNGGVISQNADYVSVQTTPQAVRNPSITQIASNSIKLTWEKSLSPNVSGFRIYSNLNSDSVNYEIPLYEIPVTTSQLINYEYYFSDLDSYKNNIFVIKSFNEAQIESIPSQELALQMYPSATYSDIAIERTVRYQITLAFYLMSSTDNVKYVLYWNEGTNLEPDVYYAQAYPAAGDACQIVINIDYDNTYKFMVKCKNSFGVESKDFGAIDYISGPSPIRSLNSIHLTSDYKVFGGEQLTWTGSLSPLTKYYHVYGQKDSFTTPIITVFSNVLSVNVPNTYFDVVGGNYLFKIQVEDEFGNKGFDLISRDVTVPKQDSVGVSDTVLTEIKDSSPSSTVVCDF